MYLYAILYVQFKFYMITEDFVLLLQFYPHVFVGGAYQPQQKPY